MVIPIKVIVHFHKININLLLASIIASFNLFDVFSEVKDKAVVLNLLGHAKADGRLAPLIKETGCFLHLKDAAGSQSHLVISEFSLEHHCNSLLLQHKHASTPPSC